MALDSGYATTEPLGSGGVEEGLAAIMTVRFRASRDVALVKVAMGASVDFIGFFALLECEVVHVTTGREWPGEVGEDSPWPRKPSRFAVGGTTSHVDGLSCTADGITVTSAAVADVADGATWELRTDTYRYRRAVAHFRAIKSTTSILLWPKDADVIATIPQLDC